MKFKVGDIIKVKGGVPDPDFEDLLISGWQGVIVEVELPTGKEKEHLYHIKWDNRTINEMSDEYLERAELEGLQASEMVLSESDIEAAEARPEEELIERNIVVLMDEEKRIALILGDDDLDVTDEKLNKYRDYLIENLDFNTVITGIEDFSWEERYVFGYGDKDEYKRLKKTRPSYRDLYKILKIEEEIDDMVGLIVKVKRLSDRKFFDLPLADLRANDKNSPEYELLQDYSIWFINWR
jgi:hypothetical protein